jgi:hypothetical protein
MPDERRCPWCSEVAAAEAAHCPACGAALTQHESIAALLIPGVTTVDPALLAYAAQPLRLKGPSPTQGAAGPAIMAAAIGGPVGLAALGGIAALAAAEYLGAGKDGVGGSGDIESVGKLSGYVEQALERLERGEVPATAPAEPAAGPVVEPAAGPAAEPVQIEADPSDPTWRF